MVAEICLRRVILSETCWGWKFGLTPLQSPRSKAHNVIWEILSYTWAQFAMPTSLSASVVYIQHCINTMLSQNMHFHFCWIENPSNVHLGKFRRRWNCGNQFRCWFPKLTTVYTAGWIYCLNRTMIFSCSIDVACCTDKLLLIWRLFLLSYAAFRTVFRVACL